MCIYTQIYICIYVYVCVIGVIILNLISIKSCNFNKKNQNIKFPFYVFINMSINKSNKKEKKTNKTSVMVDLISFPCIYIYICMSI